MEAYQQLEKEFEKWAGVSNAVACSSGTAALHLALESLQLPLGSEVILGDFNMVACARAVTLAGLVPVFVDCGEDLLIDQEQVEMGGIQRFNACGGRYVERNVRAVMAVHIYGRRCDMDRIRKIAQHYSRMVHGEKLYVIEDLAEAHGIRPHSDTDAACYSFYRNKIVAGEEGGAVAFLDSGTGSLARQLRSLGFTDAHDFTHVPRGHNYRLANSLAQLIRYSLHGASHNLKLRQQVESWHDEQCPPEWRMPPRDVVWVYDLRIPGLTAAQQDAIVQTLNAEGIAARHGFKPLSQQAEYRGCRVVGNGVAERMAREVIYLPVQPTMTEEDVRQTWTVLRRVLDQSGMSCSVPDVDARRVIATGSP